MLISADRTRSASRAECFCKLDFNEFDNIYYNVLVTVLKYCLKVIS